MTGKRNSAKAATPIPQIPPPNTHAAAILPVISLPPASVVVQMDSSMVEFWTSDPEGSPAAPWAAPELLGEQSTATILAAIANSKSSVEGKIDTLTIKCGLIRQDMDKFRGRLTEAEQRISAVEDTAVSTA